MHGSRSIAAIAATVLMGWAAGVQAQDQQAAFVNAFSGKWQTFDRSYRSGDALCSLTLTQTAKGERYDLQAKDCGGALAGVDSWGIVQNQLAFFSAETVRARLGGSQSRVTGETADGRAVILEREGATPPIMSEGCIYRGYTSDCAEPADRVPPVASGEKQEVAATVLVKLNLRSQPRGDAPVAATVPENTCVKVDECVVASDGPWCSIKVGEQEAWAKQTAIRQDRWMVLTYRTGC